MAFTVNILFSGRIKWRENTESVVCGHVRSILGADGSVGGQCGLSVTRGG